MLECRKKFLMQQTINDCVRALSSIAGEYDALCKRKYEAFAALNQVVLADINERIAAHQGEKFLFIADGYFEYTYLYGPPGGNKERTEHFSRTYIGLVSGTELEDKHPTEPVKRFFEDGDLRFPASNLYCKTDVDVAFKKATKEEALFLQVRTHKGPQWGLEDFARQYVPEKEQATLWSDEKMGKRKSVTTSLFVGNKEVEEYITRQQSHVSKLLYRAFEDMAAAY